MGSQPMSVLGKLHLEHQLHGLRTTKIWTIPELSESPAKISVHLNHRRRGFLGFVEQTRFFFSSFVFLFLFFVFLAGVGR